MARENNRSTDWRDELGKVIDASSKEEVETGKEETTDKEEKSERERDETGKFKAKEEAKAEEKSENDESGTEEKVETSEENTEGTEIKAEAKEEAKAEKIDPPAHFTAEEKKYFETLPPEQQRWIASSTNRLISTADRKIREGSTFQRRAQAFDEVLAPYRQQFALSGVDEVTVIKQLVTAYDFLQRDPANAIKWLAQSYGVDLSQAETETDPALRQVLNQVNQVQHGFQQLQQGIQSEKQQRMLAVVNQFADEKDAQGNLKHPHFEAVVDDMMKLIQAQVVPADNLELAYTRAVLFHPELAPAVPPVAKETVSEKVSDKEKSDPVKEAAEKAARAKKAAAGVKSGAGSPKTEAPKTRRQDIEELVEAQLRR